MLTLIPARGPVHTFKAGDKIIVKRGKNVENTILIHNAAVGLEAVVYGSLGAVQKRVFHKTFTSESLRNHFWYQINGKAMYLEHEEHTAPVKGTSGSVGKPRSQKFIIWCPNSHLPPRVVLDSEEQAREVAESMSARHNNTFYWCRLEGYASQKVTRKTETTVL